MSPEEVKANLFAALEKLGPRKKVLAVPPDFTRFHSKAGELTEYAWDYYGDALIDVLPGCVSPERPRKYEPVIAGEYVQGRLDATYGYRLAETP